MNRGSTAGWSAESPDVTVVPILTPAGFVGVDHRTAADAFQYARHHALGLSGGAMHRIHDGSHADVQLMDGAQIPLDCANGQPEILPQHGNQADQSLS